MTYDRPAGQKGAQARFYRLGQRKGRGWSRKSRHGPENDAGGDYLRPERKPRLDGRRSSVTPAPFLTRLSACRPPRCPRLGLRDRGGVCRWRACRQLSHRCRMKPKAAATAVCPLPFVQTYPRLNSHAGRHRRAVNGCKPEGRGRQALRRLGPRLLRA